MPDTYVQQFSLLNQLLEQSHALWQVHAFSAHHLPWQAQFPQLARCVWALDDAKLDSIDADNQQLLATLLPALKQDLALKGECWDLTLLSQALPLFSAAERQQKNHIADNLRLFCQDEPYFRAHIKERKWQQIKAFEQCLPYRDLPILEWCAGKGHLGRLLAKTRNQTVLSLEWQAALCEQGQAFADKWQLPQQFICADAFAEYTDSQAHLKVKQQAVALHACGDLHVRLLTLGAAIGTQAIAISPCCYHLIHASHYQPLSAHGQASLLRLSRHDLQLPLQQSVIANLKQQGLRHQEIAWRLGFDALQRHHRQVDAYLPLPTLKQRQLSGSFADFCGWAAAQKGLTLPATTDFDAWLLTGQARQRLTRRIDLVAHLFRQALEQWLLLDRVCFLQSQGYQVELGAFCANTITPRNALILATKFVS